MVQTYTWDLFRDPFFIGFNREVDRFARIHSHASTASYPPYNIITDGEDKFTIEIAVAGFSKADLDVRVQDETLIVKGELKDETKEINFVHKGIAGRKFTREFALGEFIEVIGAEVEDGLLKIALERILPEEKKPKVIKIK